MKTFSAYQMGLGTTPKVILATQQQLFPNNSKVMHAFDIDSKSAFGLEVTNSRCLMIRFLKNTIPPVKNNMTIATVAAME